MAWKHPPHPCRYDWCRLCRWPNYGYPMDYPFAVNVQREHGWQAIWVHAGPGAFLPKSMPVSHRWNAR